MVRPRQKPRETAIEWLGDLDFDQRSHSPGRTRYPQARRLLITADCGCSNGARVRRWKRELQALANELGLSITV